MAHGGRSPVGLATKQPPVTRTTVNTGASQRAKIGVSQGPEGGCFCSTRSTLSRFGPRPRRVSFTSGWLPTTQDAQAMIMLAQHESLGDGIGLQEIGVASGASGSAAATRKPSAAQAPAMLHSTPVRLLSLAPGTNWMPR